MKSLNQMHIRLFNSFLFGNWLISIAGFFLTISSIKSLGLEFRYQTPVLLLVGAGILLIYSVHAISQNYSSPSSDRKNWINRNQSLLVFNIVLAALLILGTLPFLKCKVFWLGIPCALVSVAYSFHIKIGERSWGLRELPFLKVLIVSVVWGLASVLLPLFQSNESMSVYRVVVLISIRFLLLLVLCLLFDIRDMTEDSNKGIRTFSSIAGIHGVKILSFILLLTLSLLAVSISETTLFYQLIVGAAIFVFIIYANDNQNDYFYSFTGDGLIILYSLAVLFSS